MRGRSLAGIWIFVWHTLASVYARDDNPANWHRLVMSRDLRAMPQD
jgi:hypothetical protein